MAKVFYNKVTVANALTFCKELLAKELKQAEGECDFLDYVNILSGEPYDRLEKIRRYVAVLQNYEP